MSGQEKPVKSCADMDEATRSKWLPYAVRVLAEIWGRENSCELIAALAPKGAPDAAEAIKRPVRR